MTLAALAKKFPTNFNGLASFTTSRIAITVQVLNEKGLSADEIGQKIAQLMQAVGESDDQNHVAEVADQISYNAEGSLRVTINSDGTASLFFPGGRRSITASFVASVLPGFQVGQVTALRVVVHKLWYELPSYHVYEGGKYLGFSLPEAEVQPGDQVGLSFELLPIEEFAKSIPELPLTNAAYSPWLAEFSNLQNFKVVDGVMQFEIIQDNPWSSVTDFTIEGAVTNYPGYSPTGGIYAEFAIKDYAGRTTNLRLRYDGFSTPALEVLKGSLFEPVKLISNDGFRLSFVYRTDNGVATVYTEPPTEGIYNLGAMSTYSGEYLSLVQGRYTSAYQIDNVEMVRDLEKAMLADGTTYDRGRLGAEIAYVVGDKNLGLKNIIIEAPSTGGRDLYTQDNTVAIQARFLKNLGANPDKTIQQALLNLATKLQEDYKNQDQMRDGYAILSYLDTDGTVKTIILEVPKW